MIGAQVLISSSTAGSLLPNGPGSLKAGVSTSVPLSFSPPPPFLPALSPPDDGNSEQKEILLFNKSNLCTKLMGFFQPGQCHLALCF